LQGIQYACAARAKFFSSCLPFLVGLLGAGGASPHVLQDGGVLLPLPGEGVLAHLAGHLTQQRLKEEI